MVVTAFTVTQAREAWQSELLHHEAAMTGDVPQRESLGLAQLIDDLGPEVVHAVTSIPDIAVPPRDVVIDDPQLPAAFDAGEIILAVGTPPSLQELRPLLARGAAGRVAAVFVRATHLDADVRAESEQLDVPVVAVAPEMSWGHLHALIRVWLAQRAHRAPDHRAEPGDLFTLANAIAARIGAPVTIEDASSRLLAYSVSDVVDQPRRQTILGQRVPQVYLDTLHEIRFFQRLREAEGVVRVDEFSEFHPRAVVAIRAGDELLGSIWAEEIDHRLDAEAETALIEAARVASLHLVHHQVAGDLARRARGERLRALLSDARPAAPLLRELELTDVPAYAVMAVAVTGVDLSERLARMERVASLVALFSEGFRRSACHVREHERIYALLPLYAETDADAVVALAHRLRQRVRDALAADVRIAVSRTVTEPAEIPVARRDADQVLEVLLADEHAAGVAVYDDVAGRVLVHAVREVMGAHPLIVDGQLQRLAAYDREQRGDLVDTLRAYLDAFGVLERAAHRLGVHPNTVRNRLARLREVFGIDLDDPVERFALELQVRLADHSL